VIRVEAVALSFHLDASLPEKPLGQLLQPIIPILSGLLQDSPNVGHQPLLPEPIACCFFSRGGIALMGALNERPGSGVVVTGIFPGGERKPMPRIWSTLVFIDECT
jgi:hypothetical protein